MGLVAEATVPRSHRWIPKGIEAEYLARAETSLSAEAMLDPIPEFGDEKFDVDVLVTITDTSGQMVAHSAHSNQDFAAQRYCQVLTRRQAPSYSTFCERGPKRSPFRHPDRSAAEPRANARQNSLVEDQRKTILGASVNAATRNPKRVVVVWAIAVVFFGLAGLSAKQVLKAEDLIIAGTPSAKAIEQERKSFGESSPLVILLEGAPEATRHLRTQARRVADADRRRQRQRSLVGGRAGVPAREEDRALLLVNVERSLFETGKDVLPAIDAVDREGAAADGRVARRRRVAILDRAGRSRLQRRGEGRADRPPLPAADPAVHLPRADRGRDPADPGRSR